MTVDDLRELHLEKSHFYSEQAPGDAIAELGVFGTAPASPTFGGTRMSTNAPDHPVVHAHSSYFEPGSEALENIVDVVTGRYADTRGTARRWRRRRGPGGLGPAAPGRPLRPPGVTTGARASGS